MSLIRASACLCAFVCATTAFAADPPASDAKAQYDTERARCLAGTTGQEQASCLQSAGAAYESIRQNKLADPSTAYRDNAMARCRALPAGDQADCISRVGGGGTKSGSVKGGGDITETVTTVPAPTTK